jgi:cobalt-zinc-cadmium efflux system membrane fusion protein
MPSSNGRIFQKVGLVTLGLILAAAASAAIWSHYFGNKQTPEPAGDPLQSVKLIGKDTLEIQPAPARMLGITIAKAEQADRSRSLELQGSLGLDTNLLARVHTRFPGEIMEIGQIQVQDIDDTGEARTFSRPLDFGDTVEKNQLIAVLWSKDLGEKKSELVSAIAQLRLHEDTLKRLEKYRESVPERTLREAQIAVEADIIAVERARRTLRSWMLTREEIQAIEKEADRIWEHKEKRVPLEEKDWARVEIRAPFAGTILERNIAPRDIVDTSADLFKVADLSHLRVWANVYEEDLPALQSLPLPVSWTVRLKADPRGRALPGRVDKIGEIVDPNDHTARVMGRVQNKDGRMKAGQFITATIDLPPDPQEVQIPAGALVEDGSESVVFVQPDAGKDLFTQRHVQVARRTRDLVFVRSVLKPPKKPTKGQSAAVRAVPLLPGERVVSSGAIELKAQLDEMLASGK